MLVSYGFWQRRFGGESDAFGRTLLVNGNAVQVLGVLPPDFETPGLEGGAWGAPEIWRTVATPPPFRSGRSWGGLARLSDGVTIETAQAQVDAATAALERADRAWEAARSRPTDPEWREQRGSQARAIAELWIELALEDERVDTLYMLSDGEPAGGSGGVGGLVRAARTPGDHHGRERKADRDDRYEHHQRHGDLPLPLPLFHHDPPSPLRLRR